MKKFTLAFLAAAVFVLPAACTRNQGEQQQGTEQEQMGEPAPEQQDQGMQGGDIAPEDQQQQQQQLPSEQQGQ